MRYSPLFTTHYTKHLLGTSRLVALAIGLTAIALEPEVARAIEFNFGNTDALPAEMMEGLTLASENWQAILIDDITIDLNVFAQDLGPDSLGSFNPNRASISYSDFVTALENDTVRSPDDEMAVSFLPQSNNFDILLNPEFDLLLNGTRNHPSGQEGDLTPYVDADGDCNNRSIRLTTATAKAVGLPAGGTVNCATAPRNISSDGMLVLNTSILWDFDPTDGIEPDRFDFVGLATQGLGITLGMVSGVDVLDLNTTPPNATNSLSFDDDILSFVSPSDLFRFSEDSLALAPLNNSTSLIDWTTGRTDANNQEVDKYFSIDGGQTKIASFSTGQRFGDGNPASFWKADELTGQYLGIFDPTPAAGQSLFITENDYRLLDVTGWDLNPALVPTDPPNAQPPTLTPPKPLPPNSTAVPEAGHGLGAIVLAAIALGRFWLKRS